MTPPDDIWELPHRHIGRRVLCFKSVSSTNDVAGDLSLDPASAGTAILAAEQTSGRGQYGRGWCAPAGSSVLLSVVLAPPADFRRAVVLTAWSAVAVSETIWKAAGARARIKWPNDVLVEGRKVCGVLIEQRRGLVAGIGLNVNQTAADFAAAGLPLAGSLAIAAGRVFDPLEIARLLLAELDLAYDSLAGGDLQALESNWESRLELTGREVVAETFDGARHRGCLRQCSFAGLAIDQPGGSIVRLAPEQVRSLNQVE
jgi:BirA family biotin operon repressor/biotin-[acetyl-CoA-carboxylase] ligase